MITVPKHQQTNEQSGHWRTEASSAGPVSTYLPQAVRLCKQQNQWKSSREKPTRRLSQFLLLGLHDSATPSLTLFPPPVSLPVVLGVILSSWISDMSLSVHIWHYCFFFLSWEKYFFPDYESNKVYYGNIAK